MGSISGIKMTTGCGVVEFSSSLVASARPSLDRAYSITAHCMPMQIPDTSKNRTNRGVVNKQRFEQPRIQASVPLGEQGSACVHVCGMHAECGMRGVGRGGTSRIPTDTYPGKASWTPERTSRPRSCPQYLHAKDTQQGTVVQMVQQVHTLTGKMGGGRRRQE